jgi:hypothetical protein
VPRICRLEAQGAGLHLKHEVDNVLERHIEHVGPFQLPQQ